MKHKTLKTLIVVGASAALSMGSVQAQVTIYSSENYNGSAMGMTNGLEIGNQITVNNASLSTFGFEYLAATSLAANVGVDVRFYLNNGAPFNGYATPGTLFFDSGWYYNTLAGNITSPTTATGGATINYTTSDFAAGSQNGWSLFNYPVSGSFTFTISWTNITPNEIEMPLANNVAGQSTGFYWVNTDGSWSLNSQPNNDPNGNFIVDFTGTVPEPSTFGLAALGGALLLGIQKLRRKG
jgi:hypothetical protein